MIRAAHAQLFKEDRAQIRIKILARVDQYVRVSQPIQLFNNPAEPNYFGSGSQQRKNFHGVLRGSRKLNPGFILSPGSRSSTVRTTETARAWRQIQGTRRELCPDN